MYISTIFCESSTDIRSTPIMKDTCNYIFVNKHRKILFLFPKNPKQNVEFKILAAIHKMSRNLNLGLNPHSSMYVLHLHNQPFTMQSHYHYLIVDILKVGRAGHMQH